MAKDEQANEQQTEAAAPEAAPEAAPVPKLTADEWAKRKGFLPVVFPQPPAVRSGHRRAVAPLPNPKAPQYGAVKAMNGWTGFEEQTEAEFDAAIKAATITVR